LCGLLFVGGGEGGESSITSGTSVKGYSVVVVVVVVDGFSFGRKDLIGGE
jgi:hypothetical protein